MLVLRCSCGYILTASPTRQQDADVVVLYKAISVSTLRGQPPVDIDICRNSKTWKKIIDPQGRLGLVLLDGRG